MTERLVVIGVLLAVTGGSGIARGQTSSIGKRYEQRREMEASTNELASVETGNRFLEASSLTAVRLAPPRKFAVHDLVTIVVREEKKFKASGESETQKDFDIKSELQAFAKPIDGGLGATTFNRGRPNIDYKFSNSLKGEADAARKDTFTTRITAEIVDVKPNGNLVLQARKTIIHDEEKAFMTLTGTCRSGDLTPDNTILSTQVADLVIDVTNEGMVRDGARRGWIPKILDTIRPF